ncbi:MAG: heparan-alpha-glucosaminide N-acetyltransferase domain-containing protein [Bacteroidales bacterium]|nr:heparan-alpha-glucosaminide N-acetyltransferase domain-containing protein [Bacteroidales bacterium]
MNNIPGKRQRFDYIDQFRGLVCVLMLVDHCSYYFNSLWLTFDPFDPLFPGWSQFALRYSSYICAPGFLILAGAMVWWSYHRRIQKGASPWSVRWHLILRGLFLILLQMTWVNSSWGGFRVFQPLHLGIIASIGFSMIFLALIVHFRWYVQLLIAVCLLVIHPFLLKIPYDPENIWSRTLMQTFIDAGKFNKYPVIPWLAVAILGSVMAHGWLLYWKTDRKRIFMSLGIASGVFLIAIMIRLGQGYGNIFPFSDFGSWSFFFDQKYPPSLYFNLWFFATVVLGIAVFISLDKIIPGFLKIFTIYGRVALFYYCIHIAIMGVFIKRIGIFYREGDVVITLIAVAVMSILMIPLCYWFFKIKRRSKNPIIKMI